MAALWAGSACFQPLAPSGLPCSPEGQCPEGQFCDFDDTCKSGNPQGPCEPPCDDDEVCSANGTCAPAGGAQPRPDNRRHVGVVLATKQGSPNRLVGTMVSSRVVLTCASCLGVTAIDSDAGDSPLVFIPGGPSGGPVDVVALAVHPTEDVAALALETPLSRPDLDLAGNGPAKGSQVIAVTTSPSAANGDKENLSVTVANLGDTDYQYSTPACLALGGPTFGSNGTGDVFHGILTERNCDGSKSHHNAIRIDRLGSWIDQQIQDAEPESCQDAVDTCTGCGVFTCDDTGGTVQTSCEPSDEECSGDDFCDPADLSCKSCHNGDTAGCGQCGEKTCSGGQWSSCVGDGSVLTCGSCGRKTCQGDGNYGACTEQEDLCPSGDICEPGGGDTFSCVDCPSPCGSCGCNPGNGTCYEMAHWCAPDKSCEPEIVGALVIFDCI